MKMKYSGFALRVLFVARKCMLSCWGRVGARTVVGTVRFAKPTGSGGTSAAGTHTVKVSPKAARHLQRSLGISDSMRHERIHAGPRLAKIVLGEQTALGQGKLPYDGCTTDAKALRSM